MQNVLAFRGFLLLGLLLAGLLFPAPHALGVQSQWVHYDATHTLVYSNDDLGNHIPDFSHAGYKGGGVPLPTNASVQQVLSPIAGDNTANIQNAINSVSALPFDANGFRGVVLLNPGVYEVDGTLSVTKSGVILRGSGNSPTGTVLHFLGASRQTISAAGSGSTSTAGSTFTLTDPYVPLGATNFNISDASSFSVGDMVVVQRPVTQVWINAINMSNYWTSGGGLHFERTITAISNNRVTVDIPLFSPIEQQWCTGQVYRVTDGSRMTNSAVENLRLRSDFYDASTNWGNSRALNIDNCKNCWIKNVVVDNFYNGINSGGGAKWITVQDCYFVSNTVPTTSAGAAAFGGSGQMTLWQRCGSSNSSTYHVFVTQAAVPGPNVFLNFQSSGSAYDSGSHQRWAAGVLFDNDTIASTSGNTGIKLENRAGAGSGQGYAAGYSLIYNGNSAGIINEIPQVNHHYNWAIGGAPGATFIHRTDDGIFDATNGLVNPRSLYLEQLRERLGGAAIENIGYQLFTISAAPASQIITPGGNVNYTVSVGDPTLMSNLVALSVSGLPSGASASFSMNSLVGSGTATLSVSTSNSIAPGSFLLNVIGFNAGISHTASVYLVVGSFSLSAMPLSQTISAGSNSSFTVSLTTNNNFSGEVDFGLGGLPVGASAGFEPPSLTSSGSSLLSVTTSSNTPDGSYTLTIYGTNVSGVSATTVTLNIDSISSGGPGVLLWTGSGGDPNWSEPLNWTNLNVGGYGPPGTNNNSILLTNNGAVTVSALTSPGSGVVIPANVNSWANTSFAVTSITNFANALNTASPAYQNLGIANGATLSISGNLQVGDNVQYDFGANNISQMTITGAGATVAGNGLTVNETSGSTGIHNAVLDLSGLDNLNCGGASIKVGIEGSGSFKRATGRLYLAKTNTLSITTGGNVAFYVGHNKSTAPSVPPVVYLGRSNVVFMLNNTGVMVGRANTPGSLIAFNPAFVTNSQNPVAYFRGVDNASRVATWNIGDNSANSTNSPNATSGTNDFSGGTIDAWVNTMQLGVSCPLGFGGTGNGFGTLTFDNGTIDVNTLQLGVDTGNSGTTAGIGVVNVNGGTLRVNTSLQMGVQAAGSGGLPQGKVNINGGTMVCPNIFGAGGIGVLNVNSGLVDSQLGSISNLSDLTVGGILQNAAFISVSNVIAVTPGGAIAGDTLISSPGLLVNGTISPGTSGLGAISNTGNLVLGDGGRLQIAVQDTQAGPGAGWGFVQAGGNVNSQANPTNPFVISLASLTNGQPGDVAGFSYNTNYDWLIVGAGLGMSNFRPEKFVVDNALFQNDLAGGYFYIRTNDAGLVLSFTNNHPPMARALTLYRTAPTMTIPITTLVPYWSDPDGDAAALAGVNPSSTNGTGTVGTDGSFIYYTNASNLADAILYTVQDIRTNPPAVYQPDDTVLTAVGEIVLLPPPSIASISMNGTNLVFSGKGGIPGSAFYLRQSTNVILPVSQWRIQLTNSFDGNGDFSFSVSLASNVPQSFYLLQVQ